jgi:hypothetical protein
MGETVINKRHDNSENAFTVCFILASTKNTYEAGLIHHGAILNHHTTGKNTALIVDEAVFDYFSLLYIFLQCMSHSAFSFIGC